MTNSKTCTIDTLKFKSVLDSLEDDLMTLLELNGSGKSKLIAPAAKLVQESIMNFMKRFQLFYNFIISQHKKDELPAVAKAMLQENPQLSGIISDSKLIPFVKIGCSAVEQFFTASDIYNKLLPTSPGNQPSPLEEMKIALAGCALLEEIPSQYDINAKQYMDAVSTIGSLVLDPASLFNPVLVEPCGEHQYGLNV